MRQKYKIVLKSTQIIPLLRQKMTESELEQLKALADIKHVVTDQEKYWLRKLCDRLNERYEPCKCPDYHHDLAMQLLIKIKRQSQTTK